MEESARTWESPGTTVAGAVVGCCDVVEEQEGFLFRKAIGVVGEDLNGLFL